MKKQTLDKKWNQLRMIHGITLRTIEGLPADQIHAHPVPGMRTPVELVVHMYSTVIGFAGGILSGRVTEDDETAPAAKIETRDQLIELARACWIEADRAVSALTDAQLAAPVQTPWNATFSGGGVIDIIYDEFLHHRGQLYAYSRALGVEPPMNWDFKNNEPAFQPKAATTA